MNKPTDEMIAKLPKWAQEHIRYLTRGRETALRALNEHVDAQTPSKIYWEEYLCTGEQQGPTNKRFYVQTDRITIEHSGIRLDVACHDGTRMHGNGIELQWSAPDRPIDMVAMVPLTFQQVALISRDNMRH